MEIIKYQVYIWIDGVNFDPERFNKTLSYKKQGAILFRKRVRDGIAENYGQYWKSGDAEISSEKPEEMLEKLLLSLKSELLKIKDLPAIRIVAEFVVIYEKNDSIRGFYFSPETIRLLSEIGAGLDLDEYGFMD